MIFGTKYVDNNKTINDYKNKSTNDSLVTTNINMLSRH